MGFLAHCDIVEFLLDSSLILILSLDDSDSELVPLFLKDILHIVGNSILTIGYIYIYMSVVDCQLDTVSRTTLLIQLKQVPRHRGLTFAQTQRVHHGLVPNHLIQVYERTDKS